MVKEEAVQKRKKKKKRWLYSRLAAVRAEGVVNGLV